MGQKAPGAGSGQFNQILESISTLESYVAFLRFQSNREQRLPQQRTSKAAPLRQAPTQAHQAGTTSTRQQGAPTFPTTPDPAFPTAPAQACSMPTFQPNPNLAPVQRTCDTMAGVAATAPDPSIPSFPVIFTLLEDGVNTTSRLWLKRLATLSLGERPPLVVCLEAPEPHIRML